MLFNSLRRRRVPHNVSAFVIATLLAPYAAGAQIPAIYPVPSGARARITATNVVLGAAIGAIRAWSTHRSVRRGLLLGAGGGLTTALGRQITATGGLYAGALGRTIHDAGLGIGSAVVDSQFTLPLHVGPLVARWTPAARRWPLVKVNLTNLLFATVTAAQPNSRIDWGATLWSGAVAIRPRNPLAVGIDETASAAPGTIRLVPVSEICRFRPSGVELCRVDLAHETLHIQQLDMVHEWIGRPIEDAAIPRRLRQHRVFQHLELGLVGVMSVVGFERFRAYETRWSEHEASWLTSGRGPLPNP